MAIGQSGATVRNQPTRPSRRPGVSLPSRTGSVIAICLSNIIASPSASTLYKVGNLAEHLDRSLAGGERVEELPVVFQPLHGMREQSLEPPRIFRLGLR